MTFQGGAGPEPGRRVAVIGSGIAGLGAAWLLHQRHSVTLYEAADRLGGHSNTVEIDYRGRAIAVDTGFIVYNERNYPNLTQLFARLGVATEPSNMSFSVSVGGGSLEWAGSSLATVFAQPANLLRPSFHGMLKDILRFNRSASEDLAEARLGAMPLGEYLDRGGYGEAFRLDYLLPMGAAIWSSPMSEMLAFPAASFVRFCVNHGLLSLQDRPAWRTVSGGSRRYVDRIAERLGATIRLATPVAAIRRQGDGVIVRDATGHEDRFEQVVIATHGDQALRLLADPAPEERRLLGAVRYQANRAVLHRDPAQMPRRQAVWSSWNYLSEARRDPDRRVGVTYWMNRLQNIDPAAPLFVTLNPLVEPDPALQFASFDYEHPLFDAALLEAQARLDAIQGRRRTWFCGAWCGFGFHEDGLTSGMAVAMALGAMPSWTTLVRPAGGPAPVLAGVR